MSDEHQQKLADALDRLEAARRGDGPILERIEKNTAILPRLLSESLRQAKSIEKSPRSVTPDAPTVAPVSQVKEPKTATADATRTLAPLRESPERDQGGRFKSQTAMAESRQETQDKSIRQVIQDAVKPSRSGFFSRRADGGTVESAAGKAAGGPIYESAKELAEAAGSIREKIQDEKTVTGRAWRAIGKRFGFGHKDHVEKGERAEQKRHRELVQAVENNRGGGDGDGGALDKIDDALDIFGNLKRKKSSLSKLPGGGAKGVGIGGLLTNPVALLGSLAAFSVGSALKSLIFGGSNPINDLFNKTGLGVDSSPPPVASKDFQKNYAQYAPTVKAAAARHGVSEDYMKTVMNIESEGNRNARSSTGAEGLYQFTRGTAKAYGIEGRRTDPAANIEAAARLTRDNMAAMRRANLPINDSNAYMAHQLGVGRIGGGGLKDLLNAQKTGQVSPALRKQMDVNGGEGMTAAQFIQMWRKKYYNKAQESGALAQTMSEKQPAQQQATPATAKPEPKTATAKTSPSPKKSTVATQTAGTPKAIVAAPRPVKQIEAPPPAPVPAPAPQVAGMEQLAAAVQQLATVQKPKEQGKPAPPVIKTEFDDTMLTLMAYDRI